MATYFADTWYFIAITDPYDNHHRRALALGTAMAHHQVVTHDAVLTELLSYLSAHGARPRERGVEAVRRTLHQHDVVHVDVKLFHRALDLYAARPDKEYSLVDCMSMVLMRDRGITHVLTNDHHFQQEGFTVLGQ